MEAVPAGVEKLLIVLAHWEKAPVQLGRDYGKFFATVHKFYASDVVRVERGEQVAFPKANEVPFIDDFATGHHHNDVRNAVNVDDETAVLVRSKETGQQRLVVEKGLFFPGPYEEIMDVQKLIVVEPHEVAIVRDNNGDFQFYSGDKNGDGEIDFDEFM